MVHSDMENNIIIKVWLQTRKTGLEKTGMIGSWILDPEEHLQIRLVWGTIWLIERVFISFPVRITFRVNYTYNFCCAGYTWLFLVTIFMRMIEERSEDIIQDPRNIPHFFQVCLKQMGNSFFLHKYNIDYYYYWF